MDHKGLRRTESYDGEGNHSDSWLTMTHLEKWEQRDSDDRGALKGRKKYGSGRR
jgi:hypothetical protein